MKILRTVYCWKNNGICTEMVQKPAVLALPLPTELIARWQNKREAFRFVEELDILLEAGKYQQEDTVAKAFEECEIDPTCSFEPKSQSKKRKRGRPKKRRVSVYDVTESESSVEEDDGNKDKRPGRLRKPPSKDFQKSLKKAITQKNKLKVEKIVENGNRFDVVIKASPLFLEKVVIVINGILILGQSVAHHLVTACTF